MNKISFLFVLVLLFTNCAKENDTVPVSSNHSRTTGSSLFNPQPNSSDGEVRSKINAFRNLLQDVESGSASFRSENMTIEEAKWNIEANLNATYSRADASFTKLDKSVDFFSVSVSGGTISNQDVATAYQTALGQLTQRYNSVQYAGKEIIVTDVQIEEVTDTEVTFKLMKYITSVDDSAGTLMPDCDIFTDPATDAWYAIGGFGNCPGEFGFNEDDAADVFAKELNLRIPNPEHHIYFTDVENVYFSPWQPYEFDNPADDIPDDSYRDFRVWYTHAALLDAFSCLDIDEMNWYFCNLFDIVEELQPEGKDFCHISMYDEGIASVQWFHNGSIFYGKSFQCPCAPCPPNVPLEDCPVCC